MWVVYILECQDGSLYTGSTNDLAGRIEEHRAGKGAAYTRMRGVRRLLWHEHRLDRSDAQKREAEIKKWERGVKLEFITANPFCSTCP